jgi:GAF domain-containing protein
MTNSPSDFPTGDPERRPDDTHDTDDTGDPMDPMRAFAELGQIRLGEGDLRQVLARIAELAKAAIPGASDVSVTLVTDQGAGTPAFTGRLALDMDESQYDEGAGPCLEAAKSQQVISVPDISQDRRWPGFTSAAAQTGVASSLSIGIPVIEQLNGALNLYSRDAGAFDDESVELAMAFANYAAVALANTHLYETTSALATQMSQAMETRAIIEQAKGILIAQQGVSGDEAFAILSRASQTSNRKLRDIARAIVDGAQQPPGRHS